MKDARDGGSITSKGGALFDTLKEMFTGIFFLTKLKPNREAIRMKALIQSKNGIRLLNLNRRKAIREMCLNCVGWSACEIKNCKHTDCQLFPYRTGKGNQPAIDRSKAIRDYCLWCCNDQLLEVSRCHNSDCPLFPYRKSTIDRTAEINSMPENDHIEAFPETKKENEYSGMNQQANLVGVGVGAYEKNLCSPGIDPTKTIGRYDGKEF
jgi:hypothetical protein